MEAFLDPEKILQELNLTAAMTAADFGAGSGGWALPLAKILSEGKVFAIDILDGPLSALSGRAKMAKILNIQTMVADVEKGVKMPASSCDLILMTNLLFQCKNKKEVIEEGKRILKPGGKILLVDWRKSGSFGPRDEALPLIKAKELAEAAGLRIEREFEASAYHYGLVLAN